MEAEERQSQEGIRKIQEDMQKSQAMQEKISELIAAVEEEQERQLAEVSRSCEEKIRSKRCGKS